MSTVWPVVKNRRGISDLVLNFTRKRNTHNLSDKIAFTADAQKLRVPVTSEKELRRSCETK